MLGIVSETVKADAKNLGLLVEAEAVWTTTGQRIIACTLARALISRHSSLGRAIRERVAAVTLVDILRPRIGVAALIAQRPANRWRHIRLLIQRTGQRTRARVPDAANIPPRPRRARRSRARGRCRAGGCRDRARCRSTRRSRPNIRLVEQAQLVRRSALLRRVTGAVRRTLTGVDHAAGGPVG